MPKQLSGKIGGPFLKDLKTVVFYPALDALTKTVYVLPYSYVWFNLVDRKQLIISFQAGFIYFNASQYSDYEIKVLILL